MTEVAAAIAIPQFDRLTAINAARRANATRLSALLGEDERIVLPRVPAGRTHVWHQYTVLLPEPVDRDAVIAALGSEGIECAAYYPRLVWDYSAYREHPRVRRDETPVAARAARFCLSLPVHQGLANGDIECIAEALLRAVR